MVSEDEDEINFDADMIEELTFTDDDDDVADNPADEDYVDIATDSDDDDDDFSDVGTEAKGTDSVADPRTDHPIGDDEEDDVIRAIKAATNAPRTHPPDITTEDFVIDLSFHPDRDILAAGTITGRK